MRIKLNKLERSTTKKQFVSKTFIVMEGTETEPIYFDCFFKKHNIHNTRIFYFAREKKEIGWSNPTLLLNEIEKASKEGKIQTSYLTISELLAEIFQSKINTLDTRLFLINYRKAVERRKINPDEIVDKSTLKKILQEIKDTYFKEQIANSFLNDISNIPELLEVTFDPSIDQVALIVDRDKKSFTETQYDFVSNKCAEKGYTFLVTNPCIEFFLALHLCNCKEKNQTLFEENKVGSNKHTFAYNFLKQKDPKFLKRKYDVQKYVSLFPTAVKNSMLYSTKIEDLKDNIGTNVLLWLKTIN